jgi:hypothetical protein
MAGRGGSSGWAVELDELTTTARVCDANSVVYVPSAMPAQRVLQPNGTLPFCGCEFRAWLRGEDWDGESVGLDASVWAWIEG